MTANRVWFVYCEKKANGPYTSRELFHLLKIGKIKSDTNLWRSGEERWKKLYSFRELRRSNVENFPSPKIPVAKSRLSFSLPSIKWQKVIISLFIFLLPVLGVKIYQENFLWRALPLPLPHREILQEALSSGDYQRLLNVYQTKEKAVLEVALAFDKNFKTLWIVANPLAVVESGDFLLYFRPVPGKTLSTDDIHFTATGRLTNSVAQMSQFKLQSGVSIPVGLYQVSFSLPNIPPQTILYGVESELKLQSLLENFSVKVQSDNEKIIQELMQKYQTFQVLLKSTGELFDSQLQAIKKGQQISHFVEIYASQWEFLLKELTFGGMEIPKDHSLQKFLLAENFKMQKIGKEIGLLVANHVEEVLRFKYLTFPVKNKIRLQWEHASQLIEGPLEKQIASLKQKIKS